jgi:hypothetical protein
MSNNFLDVPQALWALNWRRQIFSQCSRSGNFKHWAHCGGIVYPLVCVKEDVAQQAPPRAVCCSIRG